MPHESRLFSAIQMTDAHPRGFAGRQRDGTASLPTVRQFDSSETSMPIHSWFSYHGQPQPTDPRFFDTRDYTGHATNRTASRTRDPDAWDIEATRDAKHIQQI